jgi:hypothetical protein
MKDPLSLKLLDAGGGGASLRGTLVAGSDLRIGTSAEIERDDLRCCCGSRVIPVAPIQDTL